MKSESIPLAWKWLSHTFFIFLHVESKIDGIQSLSWESPASYQYFFTINAHYFIYNIHCEHLDELPFLSFPIVVIH